MSTSSEEALALMRKALTILDEIGAPMDIGAHLDLAIARLAEAIAAAAPLEGLASIQLRSEPRALGNSGS